MFKSLMFYYFVFNGGIVVGVVQVVGVVVLFYL